MKSKRTKLLWRFQLKACLHVWAANQQTAAGRLNGTAKGKGEEII